ncbi:hypothetical protein ACF1A5_03150 [Streptomyces sp. NPDC014864]|uniref:hypothetical protein n=1 Tax=Streptomyces sp. NPDC014864 TaxID=3364924 RepID=UPI0036F56E5D
MTFDPTEPETFEDEGATEIEVEAPEGDAVEQHTEITPEGDEPLTEVEADRANEADVIEQKRAVSLDEDDYR